MYDDNMKVANASQGVCLAEPQTIRERLERQLRTHIERAESIKQAIKFMDDNPNFESFHNLIGKIGFQAIGEFGEGAA